MQPSAQGIASLFMGNPGALAARVDQDRKSSPMGIPDDLRQLMALNIVTNETDAAKRQQALNELQQMAPNGQPPTVAQSLRQQAAQKLQARMVQEQQKQQAMQQMIGGLPAAGVPQGVPQPERQPQGIDEAPVEFGMASGGIVSFQDGGSVEERYRRESEEMGEGKRLRFSPDVQEYARRLQAQREGEQADYASRERQRMLGESREIAPEQIRLAGDPNVTRETMRRVGPMTAPRFEDPRIVRNAPGITAPEAPVAPPPPPVPPARRALSAGLPAAPQVAARPTTEPQAAPAAPQIQDDRLTPQGMSNASAAMRLQEEADYESRIGRPSTAALDRLLAEYERQKAETASPTGMAGLVEFLSQIAAGARPGRSSLQAAAAGVSGTQALERERAAQRAALTEKQIGLEQKKLDMARDYAKEKFGVGKVAYDKAYDRNFNMFKEQGLDVRAAQDRAQQMTLEDLRYKRQIEQEERRYKNEMKLRGMPTAEMQRQDKLIKMYIDEQATKGNKVTYLEAVQAVGALLGPKSGGYESAATALRAATSVLEDPDSTPEEKSAARQTRNAVLQGMRPGSQPSEKYTPLPANATAKDLVVGTVYQTARGPAKWDGKQFMPI